MKTKLQSPWGVIVAILLVAAPAFSQTVWNNGASNSLWSDSTNWSPAVVPTPITNVQIGTQPTGNQIFIDTGDPIVEIASLTFNNSLSSTITVQPFSIESLQVDGDITSQFATGTASFMMPVLAGANGTWGGSGYLTFNSIVNAQLYNVNIASDRITFVNSAEIVFEIGDNNTEYGRFSGNVFGNSAGTFTLRLVISGAYTGQASDSFSFFVANPGLYSGVQFDFSAAQLSSGLFWDTSQFAANGIITVIPEPATWGLMGGAGVFFLLVRRFPKRIFVNA